MVPTSFYWSNFSYLHSFPSVFCEPVEACLTCRWVQFLEVSFCAFCPESHPFHLLLPLCINRSKFPKRTITRFRNELTALGKTSSSGWGVIVSPSSSQPNQIIRPVPRIQNNNLALLYFHHVFLLSNSKRTLHHIQTECSKKCSSSPFLLLPPIPSPIGQILRTVVLTVFCFTQRTK